MSGMVDDSIDMRFRPSGCVSIDNLHSWSGWGYVRIWLSKFGSIDWRERLVKEEGLSQRVRFSCAALMLGVSFCATRHLVLAGNFRYRTFSIANKVCRFEALRDQEPKMDAPFLSSLGLQGC